MPQDFPMLRPNARQIATICLILLGILFFCTIMRGEFGPPHEILMAVGAMLLLVIWPLGRRIGLLINSLDELLKPQWIGCLLTFLISCGYLGYELYVVRDWLFPKVHDEHLYMIQARMLAIGRLWMPPIPLPLTNFFDNFYLFVQPVYATIYFPGTALLLVPFIWLHLPWWLMTLGTTSLAAVIFYLIIREFFGPTRGLLAIVMLITQTEYRLASSTLISEAPNVLMLLLLLWGWLQFRKKPSLSWAGALGAIAGLAAIVRPLDAFCFAVVIVAAIVFENRNRPRALLLSAAVVVATAAPFLFLQGIQNYGETGQWLKFGQTVYYEHYYPAPPMGFHELKPPSTVPVGWPEKNDWLVWLRDFYAGHTALGVLTFWKNYRLRHTLFLTLPNTLMTILLPAALLSMLEFRRVVMLAIVLVFLFAYTIYVFYLDHYMIAILPISIFFAIAGWDCIERAWPRQKPQITAAISLALLGLTIGMLPELNEKTIIDNSIYAEQILINGVLSQLPKQPVVVMFRYDPEAWPLQHDLTFHNQPTYNDDVAWPDDAPIIRTRDLGPQQNALLFAYYAAHQPERIFYLYDRGAGLAGQNPLHRLGTAKQLAAEDPVK
jgi:hypothetical protein